MKKLFLFMLLVASTGILRAYDFKVGDLYYNILTDQTNAVEVTYESSSGTNYSDLIDVNIPISVMYQGTNYSVTSISNRAFSNCISLTSATIPNSLTSVGNSAFRDCISLTSVSIPNSVTIIGDNAFQGCITLTSITIPNNVTSIGERAFSDCTSLISITMPESVTSIGDDAFSGCISLTSITIPNSVTSIGWYTFCGCTGLTTVTIPSSVTSIGDNAFLKCYLTELNYTGSASGYPWGAIIADEITQDGFIIKDNSIVKYVGNDSIISIPNSITSIGDRAFSECITVTSISIPNNVTRIGNNAFYCCSSLLSITIPNNVTSIENSAFAGCISLTSVNIPSSVTRIEDNAFAGCSSLKSVTIPNSVTSIGNYAFRGCRCLKSVTIPNSVTSFGDYVFAECSSLTFANIGNSVTSIGKQSFYYCSSLKSVTIGNSVTSIGENAFYLCSSLTAVNIPNSVTSIEYGAFSVCRSLTSVFIPNNVTMIGDGAFYYCHLVELSYAGSASGYPWGAIIVDEITPDGFVIKDSSIVNYVGNDSIITIPNNVTSIGNGAFNGCNSLTSVTIPNSVTSIGNSAFNGCNSLTSVTIPNSVTSIGDNAFLNCYFTELNYTGSASGYPWGAIIVDEISQDEFMIKDSSIVKYVGNDSIIIIPSIVTSIGNGAFNGCNSLTSVTIPNSVTSIGNSAFNGCNSLTSVTIPNSVTSIGNYAFQDCRSLKSVTIPNSVTSIGDFAFNNCISLTSITCEAPIPPTLGFYFVFSNHAIPCYVPMESVIYYRSVGEWKRFGTNIRGFEVVTPPAFLVTFLDWNGIVILRDTIVKDSAATAPAAPVREGYEFIGWSQDFSNIQGELYVIAQYEKVPEPVEGILVTYTDGVDNAVIDNDTIVLNIPEAPVHSGYTFLSWMTVVGNPEDGITIKAIYQEDSPTNVQQESAVPQSDESRKIFENGNVYILRDGKTYTIQGQEVKQSNVTIP